jgi:hypothetical protein
MVRSREWRRASVRVDNSDSERSQSSSTARTYVSSGNPVLRVVSQQPMQQIESGCGRRRQHISQRQRRQLRERQLVEVRQRVHTLRKDETVLREDAM